MQKLILKSPNGSPSGTTITNEYGESLKFVKDITFSMSAETCAEIKVTLIGLAHELEIGDADVQITNLEKINKDLKALGYTSIRKLSVVRNKECSQ